MAEVSALLLLDTHIVMRWISDSRRLSRAQLRAIESSSRRREPLAISAITLLEIAMHVRDGKIELDGPLDEFLETLTESPFLLLALSPAVAFEAGSLKPLKDPADRVIAATARVHGLRLVTSDQRIIESNLVSTIE